MALSIPILIAYTSLLNPVSHPRMHLMSHPEHSISTSVMQRMWKVCNDLPYDDKNQKIAFPRSAAR